MLDEKIPQAEQIKTLESLLQKIKDGSTFEELAKKYSSCPENAGDLGYFARGKMVAEFEDVVFGLKVDEVSDVFTTQFGCHIAKLLDHKDSMPCQIEYVRETIEQELKQTAAQKELNKYVDSLKKKATTKKV